MQAEGYSSISINIKYSLGDYCAAINHNLNTVFKKIKAEGHWGVWVLLLLAKPFIIFYFTVVAWFTKLKPTYVFEISDAGIKRTHAGKTGRLDWHRFHGYAETSALLLLEFTNAGESSPSHILFPKRLLSVEELRTLKARFSQQQINLYP